jgi:hypothetical protein
MADGSASGNNGMRFFIVGALCIAVVGGAYFILGSTRPGQTAAQTMEIKVEVPKVEMK